MSRWRLAVGVVGAAAVSVAVWLIGGTQTGRSAGALRPQPAIFQLVPKEATHLSEREDIYAAARDRGSSDDDALTQLQTPRMTLPPTSEILANARESSSATTSKLFSGDSEPALGSPNGTDEKQIVTIDTVDPVFQAVPYCIPRGRCEVEQDLAKRILGEPKQERDSWAYGMEFEMRNALEEVLAIDPKTRAQDVVRQVTCNIHGCLVYREQPINLRMNYAAELKKRIRSSSGIAGLNDHGQWPGAYVLHQGFRGTYPDRTMFEVIVFER